MENLKQVNVDRAMRIKLTSRKESCTNESGLLFSAWLFDTTVFFGDSITIKIPAFCDEITARYELAQYLEKHL